MQQSFIGAWRYRAVWGALLAISVVPTGAAAAQSTTTDYAHDALGRLIGVATEGGRASGDGASYKYDAAGNRMRVNGADLLEGQQWSNCASENGICGLSGAAGDQFQIRYGAGPTWSYRLATLTGSSQQVGCNNATFDDPAPGKVKRCDKVQVFASWETCASEGQACILSGAAGQQWTVRYGVEPNWAASQSFTLGGGAMSVNCDNSRFGDPAPGKAKQCQRRRVL
ncbi:RHS repeat domain-containing protein [Sphingomonas sp. VNH70]|uniref:RHS repeat domain-containing protein n=1 Tax=Sphingomonas silueang TaxID=3156617 RepID=UPI0032B45E62